MKNDKSSNCFDSGVAGGADEAVQHHAEAGLAEHVPPAAAAAVPVAGAHPVVARSDLRPLSAHVVAVAEVAGGRRPWRFLDSGLKS